MKSEINNEMVTIDICYDNLNNHKNNLYVHCLFKAFHEFLSSEKNGCTSALNQFNAKVKTAGSLFKEDRKALRKKNTSK